MKKIFILLLLSIAVISCSRENSNLISYQISQGDDPSTPQLKITMTFSADTDGETALMFQNKAWGQDSLFKVINSMKLLNVKGEIERRGDSAFVIKHSPSLKNIEFQYILQQDTEGDLTTEDSYRPVIRPNYFHLFSHNMFMLPKHILETSDDKFDVQLDWMGFSEEFTLQNSFGSEQKSQFLEGISEEEFHTAAFVGGDFRIHKLNIKGNQVAFAIRDNWKAFSDTNMLPILEKTVLAQRDFYNDHSQKYFSVTMIPTVLERGSSFQGSGLTNSFALSASNNDNLELEGLVYLLNHELQHNWIGHIIKNDNEEQQYWFSEGFTDYYTIKNIAKNHIHGLDKSYFISEFNSFVRALYTSPVKNFPNAQINYESFWSNRDLSKLPYRRGAVFAFYLDEKIKKESRGTKSLDDVMFQLLEAAQKNKKKITHDHFITTVNTILGSDIRAEFNSYIEEGNLINLDKLYTELGLEFESSQQVFDLGFTFSEDKKEIVSIDNTSAAFKAGLRAGDQIFGRSYYIGSMEHPAEFVVEREGLRSSIQYLPVAEKNIPKIIDSEGNKTLLNFR